MGYGPVKTAKYKRLNSLAKSLCVVCLSVWGAAVVSAQDLSQPMPAEGRHGDFRLRYAPDGTLSITNPTTGRSATIPRSTDNGAPLAYAAAPSSFDELIVRHARENNLRPDLVRAVVQVESGFNPNAVSPKGALGLMQLMPATARQFNVSNPFDPDQNVRAGSSYLRQLLDRYDNNEALALAAYNAGPGAVDKYGQAVPPYRETKHYVSKVTEIAGDGDGESVVASSGRTKFYKIVEIIDGREVVTYSTSKPK
jgi:soluble lytic murein transglycosylase-like protein